ncbi:MAG: hypothetical protein IJ009_07705 [Clostridia bacterium]|nr:hypothetical protein [Clostridia bacterium]
MAYKIIGYLRRRWNDVKYINRKSYDGYALYMIQEISDLIEEEHEGIGAYDFLISTEDLNLILQQNNWTMHDLIDKNCRVLLESGSKNYINEIHFV